jgi:hypothetical protein
VSTHGTLSCSSEYSTSHPTIGNRAGGAERPRLYHLGCLLRGLLLWCTIDSLGAGGRRAKVLVGWPGVCRRHGADRSAPTGLRYSGILGITREYRRVLQRATRNMRKRDPHAACATSSVQHAASTVQLWVLTRGTYRQAGTARAGWSSRRTAGARPPRRSTSGCSTPAAGAPAHRACAVRSASKHPVGTRSPREYAEYP